jgi:hypothetical protein
VISAHNMRAAAQLGRCRGGAALAEPGIATRVSPDRILAAAIRRPTRTDVIAGTPFGKGRVLIRSIR